MTAQVRLFGYRGRAPITIIGAKHDVVGVPTLLVQPYEFSQYLEVTVGEAPKWTTPDANPHVTLVRMEVIGQIRYEVNSPTLNRPATDKSPCFSDGEQEILYAPGWRISFIEAS